ncbi:related to Protein FMP23, mitochondrial [Saccharomycodes ludwigii]|uniref:Related to Protein FMP23, mitochondrial n=1 Tax=Saccharomycodes ludwigii TaxID=36035 RepID=A0A376B7P1_9ASCO|nr:hypothetical protein SCDLUD_003608 [Saccharomycodes ludwigii]KAH3900616.1 hypothetical protein SCDLUD_003608 [Saccharomycodes ludwigii]SSD60140.1 related to Protein FMP23, mitochondrial [Saccharomycodes ludwigii]
MSSILIKTITTPALSLITNNVITNTSKCFHTNIILKSKAISQTVIIPPKAIIQRYSLNNTNTFNNTTETEYKQLPEDSQYIEKFYDELETFQLFLKSELHKSFSDFEDSPQELVFELEKYIQMELLPRHTKLCDDDIKSTFKFPTMGDKLVIDRFLDFLHNVNITLVLNGGHTFIFDIIIQSKKSFDEFQKQQKTK